MGTLPTTSIEASILGVCVAHGIAPTRFGRLAVGDPRLVHDIGLGRTLRPETEQRILRFIQSLGDA